MPIGSIADIVRTHAAERPDDIALVEGARRMTWRQLHDRAARVAQALAAAGVGSQDRVAFLDRNGIEHFEVFYGAGLLNAVCVDVNWRLAAPEVEFIVNDAEAVVFVVGHDYLPVLDLVADRLTAKQVVVIGGPAPSATGPAYLDYEDWVGAHDPVDPGATSAPGDVSFQLYSSGTTGRPKGVMLSNDNFFGILPVATQLWGLSADAVNMVAMPLFHIGGGGWATAGMVTGCRSVIVRDLDPAALIDLIGEHGITHAFLVPAVLQFMLAMPNVAGADFSSLRTIVYGASPISEEVLRGAVRTFGCDFWQAYGLTETTGAVVNLAPADHDPDGPHPERLRSCGQAGPGVELRVVDPASGEEAPTGQVGEIWIRSPQVMLGYWRNEAETAKAITEDGWFRSGDAGYLDADGYLFIHDRVKDMIVSGGENVYPAEVENVLMAHPAVADAAVIGVPSERWGETAKAVLVRAPGDEAAAVTDDAIIEHCRANLARFKCPTSIDWVEALPRNPSGKILKKDLRAPYWEGRERFVG
jgi:long-chain acyl-CoA synthetase